MAQLHSLHRKHVWRLVILAIVCLSLVGWFLQSTWWIPRIGADAELQLATDEVLAIRQTTSSCLVVGSTGAYAVAIDGMQLLSSTSFGQPVVCISESDHENSLAVALDSDEILLIGAPDGITLETRRLPRVPKRASEANEADPVVSMCSVMTPKTRLLVVSTVSRILTIQISANIDIEVNEASWEQFRSADLQGSHRLLYPLQGGKVVCFAAVGPPPQVIDFEDGTVLSFDKRPDAGEVLMLTASAAGNYWAASTSQGELLVYANDSLTLLHRIPAYGPRYFSAVDFLDNTRIVTFGNWTWPGRPAGLKVWEAATGSLISHFQVSNELDGSVITSIRGTNMLLLGGASGRLTRLTLSSQ